MIESKELFESSFAKVYVCEQDWKGEVKSHNDQAKRSVVKARESWRQQVLLN